MLYAGLDLSRKRLDFHLLDAVGATVEIGASPPDADGLRGLSERLDRHGAPIRAALESMNGARFVHDRLELAGWQVEIADAHRAPARRRRAGHRQRNCAARERVCRERLPRSSPLSRSRLQHRSFIDSRRSQQERLALRQSRLRLAGRSRPPYRS
jgi:hypothetical protein